MVNTKGIKKLLIDKDMDLSDLAVAIGRTYTTTSMKLNNSRSMTLDEAEKIQEALGIHDEDFAYYFLSHGRNA